MVKRLLFIGVLLMGTIIPSIVFGKGANGVISYPGFAMEQRGSDVLTALGQDLYYEPNSGAVMLRPDLELKSMGGEEGAFTDGDGEAVTTSGGTWDLVTMPGMPELKLLHQKNVTETGWILTGSGFKANQGFVFYWKKYDTPSTLSSDFQIAIGGISTFHLGINFYSRKKTEIHYIPDSVDNDEYLDVSIPANFLNAEGEINSLVCFFAGDYIVLGINGIENAIAFKPKNAGFDPDITDLKLFTSEPSDFIIIADGSGVFGFKRLAFPLSGELISPYFSPGCNPSENTLAKITQSIQPAGTSVTGYFANGRPVEIEYEDGGELPTGRLRYGFVLRGDGTVTPYLYSWRIKDAQTRISAAGGVQTLTGDLVAYNENISGNKDGSFGDWTSALDITCYPALLDGWEAGIYQNIFTSRNAQVAINLNLGTVEAPASVLRATHYVDIATVGRPEHGSINLYVEAQSIVKRLKLTPVAAAESFDDRGWRHGDLMSYLASRGGVVILNGSGSPLSASDYASDPLLPASQEKDRANWQFNPGASLWDAMLMVREYSGWCLYPDNQARLIYKPFPTSASTPDWTLNMEDFMGVRYAVTDLARTRFMVVGQAGADDSAGRFKKGDGILSYKTNSTLETLMGESRPLYYLDPALGSPEMADNMCGKFYDYYTNLHRLAFFEIPNFKTYKSMQLYQVIDASDPLVSDIDGKYLIIGLRCFVDPSELTFMRGNVEMMSL